MQYIFSDHQKKQVEVIDEIEKQVINHNFQFSTVLPVSDFENDSRMCLTGIHFPDSTLIEKIRKIIIDPLKDLSPEHYYYKRDSLHITIKSIRTIHDPSRFSNEDIKKVGAVFSNVIPKHKTFSAYFYRLLLFPHNLALIGTTDPELDTIHLDLNRELKIMNVPDDKIYANNKYFFGNMTLVRFKKSVSKQFIEKVSQISSSIQFEPYQITSISLVSANAVFKKRTDYGTWMLQ